MTAILKKELRIYFSTFTGYLFIAFMLLCGGIFTSFVNVVYYSPNFEYAVRNMTFVLLIAVPLLTMRVFSEEKKQKTEQLLYMLPVSFSRIVMGKFLAIAIIMAIPVIIMAFYPVAFSFFGVVNFKTAYTTLLAFFLLECALCSIGMFASSLTENQLIAAVISFGITLIIYMIPDLSANTSSASSFAVKAFAVIIAVLCVIVFFISKKIKLSLALAVIAEAVLWAVYYFSPAVFAGSFGKFLDIFALFEKIGTFANGICDITIIIYYISITLLFLCFTVQSESKRRWR